MLVKGDREVATVVLDDFARGLEDVKIAVLNAVNDENFPNVREFFVLFKNLCFLRLVIGAEFILARTKVFKIL